MSQEPTPSMPNHLKEEEKVATLTPTSLPSSQPKPLKKRERLTPKQTFWIGVVTAAAITSVSLITISAAINAHNQSSKKDTALIATNGSVQNINQAAPAEKVDRIDPSSVRYIRGAGTFTFIEYCDLEAPFCKQFHANVNGMVDTYKDKIAFGYKHFPLNVHSKAKREAGAAECAGRQDKFFKYVNKILEITPSNNGLEDARLFEVAKELELNMDTFTTCLDKEEYAEVVTADALEAQGTQAAGAPHSVIIDADGNIKKIIQGSLSAEQLKGVLDEFLKQQ